MDLSFKQRNAVRGAFPCHSCPFAPHGHDVAQRVGDGRVAVAHALQHPRGAHNRVVVSVADALHCELCIVNCALPKTAAPRSPWD